MVLLDHCVQVAESGLCPQHIGRNRFRLSYLNAMFIMYLVGLSALAVIMHSTPETLQCVVGWVGITYYILIISNIK